MGTRLSQVTSQDYTLLKAREQTIIQIDIASSSIGKAFAVDVGIVADMKNFLQTALSVMNEGEYSINHTRIKLLHEQYLKDSSILDPIDSTSYTELNSVMRDLTELVPENSVITSDAGNFYGWLARYFRFSETKRYIGPTSGAMGYGFPAALGVKIGRPNQTVISFSGDGGFTMTMQELETAAREQIQVIAIVVNNNMYGTIRAHQEKQFPNRVMATMLTKPSFSEKAKFYGCDGAKVKDNASFRTAFEIAMQSKVPYVIEVQTDPNILSVTDTVIK